MEYLNAGPVISCECMCVLHSWGKHHGLLVFALRDYFKYSEIHGYKLGITQLLKTCYFKMCIYI